ncbi:MAG: cysteine synthase family protein [Bacteroidales bacterium]|jgi:cysteine synthase A|nr:cysteine synthase family protein [Bacteroidales bacterium]
MDKKLKNTFDNLWRVVGNTPMLELHYRYKGKSGKVYAKLEYYNLSGSLKDRMALHILQQAYIKDKIRPEDRIVEATSGNTGISFATIGKALGHQVTIIMPNWLSKERIDIIKSLGADIKLISKEDGGFLGSIKLSQEMATSGGIYLPRQFDNCDNIRAHYLTTGPEIMRQLVTRGKHTDAFIAGVGTGGTVMGVGTFLKAVYPKTKVYPLEPTESPTLSTGHKIGAHRIQGISDEFIPSICSLNLLDEVTAVNDGDAILAAQKLAKHLGLAVGISSGANIIGAIKINAKLNHRATVVTVIADDNKKYLSTDLVKDEPEKDSYLSPEIVFDGYETL